MVIAQLAELLKRYNITEVYGDKYAIGFHEAEWRAHGIKFIPCETTTSENYLIALPQLLATRVRLLTHQTLRNQLSSLERRVGVSDRESVSHPQHANAHDDVAAAVCGAIAIAAKPTKVEEYMKFLDLFSPPLEPPPAQRAADEFQHARLAARIFELSGRTLWPR